MLRSLHDVGQDDFEHRELRIDRIDGYAGDKVAGEVEALGDDVGESFDDAVDQPVKDAAILSDQSLDGLQLRLQVAHAALHVGSRLDGAQSTDGGEHFLERVGDGWRALDGAAQENDRL